MKARSPHLKRRAGAAFLIGHGTLVNEGGSHRPVPQETRSNLIRMRPGAIAAGGLLAFSKVNRLLQRRYENSGIREHVIDYPAGARLQPGGRFGPKHGLPFDSTGRTRTTICLFHHHHLLHRELPVKLFNMLGELLEKHWFGNVKQGGIVDTCLFIDVAGLSASQIQGRRPRRATWPPSGGAGRSDGMVTTHSDDAAAPAWAKKAGRIFLRG